MLKGRNLWLMLAAIGAFLTFGTVFALATPGSGATGPVVARGTLGTQPVTISVPKVVTVKVKKKVKGKIRTVTVKKTVAQVISACGATPCDTAVQQVTIVPGGTSGWHSHPGSTLVAIASGEGTEYHAMGTSCISVKYPAGSGFFQTPADVHVLRNEGTVPLVTYVFYILPSGTANTGIRIDQSAPAACPNIN